MCSRTVMFFNSSFFSRIFYILIILFNFVFNGYHQLTQDSKLLLGNKLKSKFLTDNINTSDFTSFNNSLFSFQEKILKTRNNQCEVKVEKLNKINETKWQELLIACDQLDSSVDTDVYLEKILESLNEMCIDSKHLMHLFSINNTDSVQEKINNENLFQMVLSQISNKGCDMCVEEPVPYVISRAETWGYGLFFVTIISMSSLCGAFVIPLSNKKIYKKVLMAMIGIAVGSLAGSGFLHLIPQAFGIADDPKHHDYVWKGLTMMFGVYLFYLVEKFLKIMITRKKIKRNSSKIKMSPNDNQNQILESIAYVKTHESTVEPNVEMRVHIKDTVLQNNNLKKITDKSNNHHGHSHHLEDLQSVAPVAWMIIFGDGLHNFIDGLSIGAAFTESIFKGISICLAVICEEFPHELGDFAILLNAGMSYRMALFFNFLSACACYAGLAVGIVLGGDFEAGKWIYAIAGGMFLYISLCDMVPELNEMGEEIERDYIREKRQLMYDEGMIPEEEIYLNSSGSIESMETFDLKIKLKVLFMQHIGILFGLLVMLLMALYGPE